MGRLTGKKTLVTVAGNGRPGERAASPLSTP